MSIDVSIRNTTKFYGDFKAIDDVSVEVKEGEFFTLLGPSGCGKTTLLRMIAGFNTIEGGDIYFGEQRINDVSAHKRDIGMVFQNYAVFPHLSVYDNVGYGLKARKVSKDESHRRIMEALQTVQIEELKDRMPSALSGGQQQRVALARAIVIEPKILLMDEPLSNLDAKLRVQMRSIIKKLQRQLNITTIYVTHDQEEALAISDRIAVMNHGKIIQVDTPDTIYKQPADKFVSSFIGTSNFLKGLYVDGMIKIGNYSFYKPLKGQTTKEVLLSVRPEQFLISDNKEGIKGEIQLSTFLGDFITYEILLESGEVIEVNEFTQIQPHIRDDVEVYVVISAKDVMIYDLEGTVALNE
ncbi:MAG: ABC transporter ATP-binding protein [Erysipelothrix sp.]|nr:ABC transporter ATP-binding protein [Erysipelothrix sp.]